MRCKDTYFYGFFGKKIKKTNFFCFIENPDRLLAVYNELHNDSMLVPRIPMTL